MGEKKKTMFEINIENFEFSPNPRFGGELGQKLEEYEKQGSKLGLFGSKEDSDEELEEETDDSGGLFSRKSTEADEEDLEETEVEIEAEEEAEDSGSGLALVIGLLFLLVVAAVATKFVGNDDVEEYEEVELSEYEN